MLESSRRVVRLRELKSHKENRSTVSQGLCVGHTEKWVQMTVIKKLTEKKALAGCLESKCASLMSNMIMDSTCDAEMEGTVAKSH